MTKLPTAFVNFPFFVLHFPPSTPPPPPPTGTVSPSRLRYPSVRNSEGVVLWTHDVGSGLVAPKADVKKAQGVTEGGSGNDAGTDAGTDNGNGVAERAGNGEDVTGDRSGNDAGTDHGDGAGDRAGNGEDVLGDRSGTDAGADHGNGAGDEAGNGEDVEVRSFPGRITLHPSDPDER